MLLVAALMIVLITKAVYRPPGIGEYLKTKYMKKVSYLFILMIIVAAVIANIIFFVGFSFGNNSTSLSQWSEEGRVGYGFVFVFFNLIAMACLIAAMFEKSKSDE